MFKGSLAELLRFLMLPLQLQLQLQPHHTTLFSAVVGEVTTATKKRNTTPTTFRSISGSALPSMHLNNSPLLSLTIFENPPQPCAVLVVYFETLGYEAEAALRTT